jgi:hypothetical protein
LKTTHRKDVRLFVCLFLFPQKLKVGKQNHEARRYLEGVAATSANPFGSVLVLVSIIEHGTIARRQQQ